MTHQCGSSMNEILLQILFLPSMFLMTFSVAKKVQSKIKFSSRAFSDFLLPNIRESIILCQITEDEIFKIISFLDSSKSTGPNNIFTKILKPLQVQISKHLTDKFDLSFTTSVFPNPLKSPKVIPVHKKTLNWLYLIIGQYLFFPKWSKLLRK